MSETEKNPERTIKFRESTSKYLAEEAKRTGKSESEIIENLLGGNWCFVEFDETTGKAALSMTSWDLAPIPEESREPHKVREEYRKLRDDFAPVTAGIEFHRRFLGGGGFTVVLDDPADPHKIEMKEAIIEFNKLIYQDYYTRGLDRILYSLTDEVLTIGAAGAEIVWEKEPVFEDFITKKTTLNREGKQITTYKSRLPTEAEWKQFKGVKRLKIIGNAIERLKPYRDPISMEVLFWTLDAEQPRLSKDEREVFGEKTENSGQYFLPWQILWLSWNTRGNDLIGQSIIKPVFELSLLVREIWNAAGKGFKRWANKRYFFVTGTESRPWSDPTIRNFLKLIQQMVKENWTGMPVPWGFDIKEIGGEVFEGRDLLNHLITMIAGGMTYPVDFLEAGRTRADDKSWLAWQVTYGTNQLQLRRAIEQQLWQPHLWSLYGFTYDEKKQGVRPEDRRKLPIYIPKLEWRAEGKWHAVERLKMDAQILNVANPIGPELKLAVEIDIAKIMGWSDIEFPSFEELRAELKRQDREEKLKAKLKEKQLLEQETEPAKAKPKEKTTEEPEEEEQTTEKIQKRLEGGVSTVLRPTGGKSKKGVAKNLGGTRQPKVV